MNSQADKSTQHANHSTGNAKENYTLEQVGLPKPPRDSFPTL
jgi:hypothetical protein